MTPADTLILEEQTIQAEALKPTCEQLEGIYDKVDCYADKHGVERWLLHHIVDAESDYNPMAHGDTHMPGGSNGLVQINKRWNPSVTLAQAQNPDFALEWASSRLANGQCFLWSTCPW